MIGVGTVRPIREHVDVQCSDTDFSHCDEMAPKKEEESNHILRIYMIGVLPMGTHGNPWVNPWVPIVRSMGSHGKPLDRPREATWWLPMGSMGSHGSSHGDLHVEVVDSLNRCCLRNTLAG